VTRPAESCRDARGGSGGGRLRLHFTPSRAEAALCIVFVTVIAIHELPRAAPPSACAVSVACSVKEVHNAVVDVQVLGFRV